MVDNIIANSFFTTVLHRLAELDWDLRLHYEVKSNLKPAEIDIFRAARVSHVQPGIESLVSPALKIMDKGVAGTRNVRTLRDCEAAGLTVTWNWLYGFFPEERAEDYEPVLRQIPALMHVQHPAGASRILLNASARTSRTPRWASRTAAPPGRTGTCTPCRRRTCATGLPLRHRPRRHLRLQSRHDNDACQ
ncbi:hypothetical protein [Micromonospora inyonensis]|uniref:hypothetical protein n=1 Tax=Micromonospora inyonensis TaxID=47866 RepID=UPI000B819B9C|nr:hypothetical protein [Micromonospora inyonensis]